MIICMLWSYFMLLARFCGSKLLHNLKPNLHCSSCTSCSKGRIRYLVKTLSVGIDLSINFTALRCSLVMSFISFFFIIVPQILRQ